MNARLKGGALAAAMLEQLQADEFFHSGSAWVYVHSLETSTFSAIDWTSLAEDDGFAGELYRLGEQLGSDEEAWRMFARDAISEIEGHTKLGKLGRRMWDELPARWLTEARELAIGLIAEEGEDE